MVVLIYSLVLRLQRFQNITHTMFALCLVDRKNMTNFVANIEYALVIYLCTTNSRTNTKTYIIW